VSDIGMNPDQIERVFGTLGRIEQKLDSHLDAFNRHIEDDKRMGRAIYDLSQAQSKQRGFFAGLSTVGSLIGAGIGYLVERWITGSHS